MKKNIKEKGITLIALVVTIIVLLILAMVSVSLLSGNNGIITQAKNAKEKSVEGNEKELLQIEITSNRLETEDNQNENKIGEELKDRKVGDTWKVLVTENEIYGTNWYYVPKETVVANIQKLENNYVINYQTGEIKKLRDVKRLTDITNIEDNKCDILLTSEDSVGVPDGLILNFDTRIASDGATNNKDVLEGLMGSNVTLNNFNYDQSSGLYDGNLLLDGVDDYITVECGTTEDKMNLIENGFTIEFSGNAEPGITYAKKNGFYNNAVSNYGGLYFYGDHTREVLSDFRCSVKGDQSCITWAVNSGSRKQGAASDYSDHRYKHNVVYPFKFNQIGEKSSNFVITLDPKTVKECNDEKGKLDDGSEFTKSGKYIKASLWSEGKLVLNSDFAMAQWDTFTNNTIKDCNEFVIGFVYTSDTWGIGPMFAKMQLQNLRIYNRALKEDEIAKNWITDETYKQFMNFEN